MKKQLIKGICGLFCTAAFISCTYAQTMAMLPETVVDAKTNAEYNLAAADNTPPASAAIPISAVTPKVLKSFTASFKNVPNVQWYALNKKTYLATFNSNDGRTSRAAFAKSGYMYYAISAGDEKSLPKEERRLIKSNYVDYTIGSVSEVHADGQKVWIVNLQDGDTIIIARIANGSIDELARFQTRLTEKKHKKGKVLIPQ